MTLERACSIKNYIHHFFAKEEPSFLAIKQESRKRGIPEIEVPAHIGKLLYCLTKIQKPRRVLEIGTLAGYSTLWIAKALNPGSTLLCLELDPSYAALTRSHLASHLDSSHPPLDFEVREGEAAVLLDQMIAHQEDPFDLIFIDADKENYPTYLEKSLQLSHSGTLILSDNLIPKGDNIGTPENDEAHGIYQFNTQLSQDPRLESILTTTIVGEKGRIDALGISIVV